MAKKNQTEDEIVQELIKVVQQRKEEIAKTEKAKWQTNCSLEHGGTRINLQTISDKDKLIKLAGDILHNKKIYEEGSNFLFDKVEVEFAISGFTADQWLADIKTRVEKVQLSAKKRELETFEKRLDALVSPEVRKRLELQAIKEGLGI